MREMAFEKVVISQEKKTVGRLTILTIEVNGQTCNCNRNKLIYQILSCTNRNIVTKVCKPYNTKTKRSYGENWSPVFFSL